MCTEWVRGQNRYYFLAIGRAVVNISEQTFSLASICSHCKIPHGWLDKFSLVTFESRQTCPLLGFSAELFTYLLVKRLADFN